MHALKVFLQSVFLLHPFPLSIYSLCIIQSLMKSSSISSRQQHVMRIDLRLGELYITSLYVLVSCGIHCIEMLQRQRALCKPLGVLYSRTKYMHKYSVRKEKRHFGVCDNNLGQTSTSLYWCRYSYVEYSSVSVINFFSTEKN